MKCFELNTIQRVLLVASAIALILFQFNRGSDGFAATLAMATVLLLMAFSGGVRLLIPPMLKTATVAALIVSVIANITQAISYKEALAIKDKNQEMSYALDNANLTIKRLESELSSEKVKNRIASRSKIPKDELFHSP